MDDDVVAKEFYKAVIGKLVEEVKDTDLLDLVYRMLLSETL
jgi:hypothetical protein